MRKRRVKKAFKKLAAGKKLTPLERKMVLRDTRRTLRLAAKFAPIIEDVLENIVTVCGKVVANAVEIYTRNFEEIWGQLPPETQQEFLNKLDFYG